MEPVSKAACYVCDAIRYGLAFSIGVLAGIVWALRFG